MRQLHDLITTDLPETCSAEWCARGKTDTEDKYPPYTQIEDSQETTFTVLWIDYHPDRIEITDDYNTTLKAVPLADPELILKIKEYLTEIITPHRKKTKCP